MNLTKYFPIVIACIVFIVFLVVRYTVPDRPLNKEVEKEEVGIDIKMI